MCILSVNNEAPASAWCLIDSLDGAVVALPVDASAEIAGLDNEGPDDGGSDNYGSIATKLPSRAAFVVQESTINCSFSGPAVSEPYEFARNVVMAAFFFIPD